MPSPARRERVIPVSRTAWPNSSSHGLSKFIWVVSPAPSVPSITINFPERSERRIPGRSFPYVCLMAESSDLCVFEMALHDLSNLPLLRFHGQRGVDGGKTEFRNHFFVFFDDAALKHPEAVFGISRQSQIQTRFVKLETIASAHNAADGRLQ